MFAEFIKSLRAEFYERIEQKNGWGREELKMEFERALADSLATIADMKEE